MQMQHARDLQRGVDGNNSTNGNGGLGAVINPNNISNIPGIMGTRWVEYFEFAYCVRATARAPMNSRTVTQSDQYVFNEIPHMSFTIRNPNPNHPVAKLNRINVNNVWKVFRPIINWCNTSEFIPARNHINVRIVIDDSSNCPMFNSTPDYTQVRFWRFLFTFSPPPPTEKNNETIIRQMEG